MSRPLNQINPLASPQGLRIWALAAVAIALTQLTEPLAEPTALQVAGFWAGRVAAIVVSFGAAEWLIRRLLSERCETPAWLKPVVMTTLAATVGLTAVELVLESQVPQRAEYDDAELFEISPLLAGGVEYVTILTVLLPINFVLWLLIDHRSGQTTVTPDSSTAVEPDFLRKTRGIKATDVVALGAEEHYVRVYSTTHNELVHHRLSDAVKQMPPQLGMRVHRSWWVADRFVTGARRKTRRWELVLDGKMPVPVSDSFNRAARERGYYKVRASSLDAKREHDANTKSRSASTEVPPSRT